jgi:hypothetical protein
MYYLTFSRGQQKCGKESEKNKLRIWNEWDDMKEAVIRDIPVICN